MRLLVAAVGLTAVVVSLDAGRAYMTRANDVACQIAPDGQSSGPSADICAQVVRRWQALVGLPPTPGEIRLVAHGETRNAETGGSWRLEWPAPSQGSASVARRKRDGLPAHIAETILPHEAGHHVFNVYLGMVGAPWDGHRYASPAPDWIDEEPAIWMESKSSREGRMRSAARARASLARLLTMEHPAREWVVANSNAGEFRSRERTVTPPCPRCTFLPDSVRNKYQIVEVGVDARGRPDTIVSYSDKNPNSSTVEEREFYPLAYGLLRFIRVRGGQAAVRELIARYRTNPTARVDAVLGLPGLPSTLSTFESAWLEFLRNPPAEDS